MKTIILMLTTLLLTACSQGVIEMQDRSKQVCGDKPNCVSTLDSREQHHLDDFTLIDANNTSLEQIKQAALTLSGAKLADEQAQYLRIECTSFIFRFIDDLEIRIEDNQLLVRSESRTGHSDFGVNRKRTNTLRTKLTELGIIK
ncbi:MAG: DUF1499 domain-containing protein [Aliivibrio sp.]|uniref:DUF1499 domain-containing protein n=1 Tax=Aliivibrio sp. TaxID=1872443 RepID=UPI001A5CF41A|nr:DUF1499 domain-containing protein [Aliivibrio sp.]